MTTAALLLSRQPLYPCASSIWVQSTLDALDWIKEKKYHVYTSIGSPTWEFITAISVLKEIPQVCVIPSNGSIEFEETKAHIKQQFSIDSSIVTFVHLQIDSKSDKKNSYTLRDQYIIEKARILVPISIRKKGSMASLLEEYAENKIVDQEFQKPYVSRSTKISYSVDEHNLSEACKQLEKKYLIHWTRTCNGPWPSENAINYYQDISTSEVYPRSAYHTLQKIILSGEILASWLHMPHNTPAVSFTRTPSEQFIELMRWRSRYVQMSFEPYGIGIDYDWAVKNGICKVAYSENRKDQSIEPWLIQTKGEKSDWTKEQEYRFKGDFLLTKVPSDQIIALCKTPEESENISRQFGMKALSLLIS